MLTLLTQHDIIIKCISRTFRISIYVIFANIFFGCHALLGLSSSIFCFNLPGRLDIIYTNYIIIGYRRREGAITIATHCSHGLAGRLNAFLLFDIF